MTLIGEQCTRTERRCMCQILSLQLFHVCSDIVGNSAGSQSRIYMAREKQNDIRNETKAANKRTNEERKTNEFSKKTEKCFGVTAATLQSHQNE